MKDHCATAKRAFDLTAALILLAVFWPFIILIAVMIRLFLGRSIIFRQTRPGLCGKRFDLYKFRTMTPQRTDIGAMLADEQRLTKFGRFLRETSVDELPELINVIKGEMSLVGPRPLLMEYLPLYTMEQSRRHEVRPGITGWAQVNGRNAITWEEKFKLDVWYVDNQSFWLDVKILFMTISKVFKREGISQEGRATMEKFTGNGSKP